MAQKCVQSKKGGDHPTVLGEFYFKLKFKKLYNKKND